MNDARIQMDLDGVALRTLYQAVDGAFQRWSGGEPEEQEELSALRNVLFAALLDVNYK